MSEATFKTGEVADLFDVTPETVRSWSDKFSEFLSGDAAATKGTHRVYHYRDLRILAFVDDMRKKFSHDEIILSLKAISDDDLPNPPEPPDGSITISQLGNKIVNLQEAYNLQEKVLEQANLEIARMEERLKVSEASKEELEKSKKRVEILLQQNAQLKLMLKIERGQEVNFDD